SPPIHTLPLHDALPISQHGMACQVVENEMLALLRQGDGLEDAALAAIPAKLTAPPDQAHALLRAGNNGDTLLYSSFPAVDGLDRSEEHTSELQSRFDLV